MLRTVFECDLIHRDFGRAILKISGNNCNKIFENESGLHQWQRIPPTERHNRTHTSLVAVLLYTENYSNEQMKDSDIEFRTTRGTGNGGQARNKLETCVIVKHIPTGITVRCQSERSQLQNKLYAIELLKAKLNKIQIEKSKQQNDIIRTSQIGNLNRGSDKKVRIYKEKLNLIVDVKTSKKGVLTEWLKGNMQF